MLSSWERGFCQNHQNHTRRAAFPLMVQNRGAPQGSIQGLLLFTCRQNSSSAQVNLRSSSVSPSKVKGGGARKPPEWLLGPQTPEDPLWFSVSQTGSYLCTPFCGPPRVCRVRSFLIPVLFRSCCRFLKDPMKEHPLISSSSFSSIRTAPFPKKGGVGTNHGPFGAVFSTKFFRIKAQPLH